MSIESVPDAPSQSEIAARFREAADDVEAIRYSLTALGEAFVADRARARFRGFGPCTVATIGATR